MKKIEAIIKLFKLEDVKSAALTGKTGDGIFFVYDIDSTLRIRTDEKDNDAL